MRTFVSEILLGLCLVTAIVGDTVMDQVFGEALLNSLNPALKEKLENIYNDDTLKNKPVSKVAKIVKAKLDPEEIKEMERAYKRLLLPMVQSTLQSRLGRKIDNIDDLPIEFEDLEESSEVEIEDLTPEEVENIAKESEILAKEANKDGKKVIKERTANNDSLRPIGDGKPDNVEEKISKQKVTSEQSKDPKEGKGSKKKDSSKDEL